jgi:hypothetical protein
MAAASTSASVDPPVPEAVLVPEKPPPPTVPFVALAPPVLAFEVLAATVAVEDEVPIVPAAPPPPVVEAVPPSAPLLALALLTVVVLPFAEAVLIVVEPALWDAVVVSTPPGPFGPSSEEHAMVVTSSRPAMR